MAVPKLSLPSALGHDFAKVQSPSNPRSSFDRSFTRKTTFAPANLVPVYVDEVLPGDTITMNAKFVARVATLLYPIMDNLHLDTFWFFAPMRILWDNFKRFNGERPNPGDSIDFLIPNVEGSDPLFINAFSIGDYMGIPVGIDLGDDINALPFRMYNRVYNDWFRDENLQNSATVNTGDGPDFFSEYPMQKRGKRHDYFAGCLPWPQKGDAVFVPLGSTAPIIGTGDPVGFTNGTIGLQLNYNNNTGFNGILGVTDGAGNVGSAPVGSYPVGDQVLGLNTDGNSTGMVADLTSAVAATVNDMRQAVAIQQLLELDARGGTRYIEQMEHMWGVKVPDYRLQRPEYLGGSSKRMDIHAVPQTATGVGPQGSLSAFGQMEADSGFTYSALEHGYIMCIVNVRADVTYQQGLHKMWNRRTRYDFYQPPLAHLGEQPVYVKELYYTGVPAADNVVFGYQERWAEYRYAQNLVTGAMRSSYAQTLDAWHLALNFTAPPDLEADFIIDAPPVSRITAVSDGIEMNSQILLDMYAQSRWARIMPVYSTPGLERL